MFRVGIRIVALLSAGLALAAALACGGANRRSLFGGDLTAKVEIDPTANLNSPVAVEVLVVYDKQVLDRVMALSARDWFINRDQFRRDHPEGFTSQEWEWAPGQVVPPLELAFGVGARAGVVFADYATAGTHRALLDPHQNVRIRFQDQGFTVEPLP